MAEIAQRGWLQQILEAGVCVHMMMQHDPATSLWQLIESMQRRLEAEGLSTEVVDAAVSRGLEIILRSPRQRRRLSLAVV